MLCIVQSSSAKVNELFSLSNARTCPTISFRKVQFHVFRHVRSFTRPINLSHASAQMQYARRTNTTHDPKQGDLFELLAQVAQKSTNANLRAQASLWDLSIGWSLLVNEVCSTLEVSSHIILGQPPTKQSWHSIHSKPRGLHSQLPAPFTKTGLNWTSLQRCMRPLRRI